jgi:hypothetical protein
MITENSEVVTAAHQIADYRRGLRRNRSSVIFHLRDVATAISLAGR